jgi:hypothetical protein
MVAYMSFFKPDLRYEMIESATKIADNIEPAI